MTIYKEKVAVMLAPNRENMESEKQKKAIYGFLSELHEIYKNSGNALYPWACIRYCRMRSIALPSWVQDYLGDVADRLSELGPGSDTAKQSAQIVDALGLRGGASGLRGPFTELDILRRRERTALAFATLILQGAAPKKAYGAVADAVGQGGRAGSVSESTVKSDVKNFFGLNKAPADWRSFFEDQLASNPEFVVLLTKRATNISG